MYQELANFTLALSLLTMYRPTLGKEVVFGEGQ